MSLSMFRLPILETPGLSKSPISASGFHTPAQTTPVRDDSTFTRTVPVLDPEEREMVEAYFSPAPSRSGTLIPATPRAPSAPTFEQQAVTNELARRAMSDMIKEGLCSRSSYELTEILNKLKNIRKGNKE
ncbi:hypothetical protein AC249_AIPGENE10513 [Exaiptasia diaphana]|nr:hypothetical protein AC249_AIPGENE10513 [Exaiptasia diaphana]